MDILLLVFLVSLLLKNIMGEGRGHLFQGRGGGYLIFWPRGQPLFPGKGLIRTLVLIRGNTWVCNQPKNK